MDKIAKMCYKPLFVLNVTIATTKTNTILEFERQKTGIYED